MSERYDVIVIGSGFGGAVVACRLSQAGRKVLVLERGREWRREDYPRKAEDAWIWDDAAPERRNGWIDFRYFGDMTVVQGAAVGGGSLIYANIFIEPPREVFDEGWPPEITYDVLKPHLDEAARMLGVRELPDGQLTERTRLMREAAELHGSGDRFRKLPLAVTFNDDWHYGLDEPHSGRWSKRWTNEHGVEQGTCIHCGNCVIGCWVGAKNTLDLNYLAAARSAGAEIRALHIARCIVPTDAGGYRVEYERIDDDRLVAGACEADRVVLAAGSLGSTELLLRCRDEYGTLPRVGPGLGVGWSCNGDFLTPALYPGREVAPSRGPTTTSVIDFGDGSQGGHRFFVEDAGFPSVVGSSIDRVAEATRRSTPLLGEAFTALQKFAHQGDTLDCVMPWFGQAMDASDGLLTLGRPWWWPFGRKRLMLDWDVTSSEGSIQALVETHKRLSELTGGEPVEPPYWKYLRDLITPHPLGGCAMGSSPHDGVVGSNGEVFGHRGLYVADSAIVPMAIGRNPSRTIAALAEHIAGRMVADG